MKGLILSVVLLLFSFAVHSASLFGVELHSSNRDQLRSAVKKSGLKLVREAGKDVFYDQYKSHETISTSSHLYLGYE